MRMTTLNNVDTLMPMMGDDEMCFIGLPTSRIMYCADDQLLVFDDDGSMYILVDPTWGCCPVVVWGICKQYI